MLDFISEQGDIGGLILFSLFFLLAVFIRTKDCREQKRNLVTSFLISFLALFLNTLVGGSLFYCFGYGGGYVLSLYNIPFYLQYFYFIFSIVVGIYIFSKFYLFTNKFYLNYLEKGIFSFKRKSGKTY